jgi:hypothetical protein
MACAGHRFQRLQDNVANIRVGIWQRGCWCALGVFDICYVVKRKFRRPILEVALPEAGAPVIDA